MYFSEEDVPFKIIFKEKWIYCTPNGLTFPTISEIMLPRLPVYQIQERKTLDNLVHRKTLNY